MSGDYPVKVKELREMPIFERLTESQLECLARVMIRRTYAAGQSVFLEGDPAVGVWFVVDGQVRIIKQSSSGRVQGLCVMNSKKCFGTCPLFDGDTNLANAVAVTEVTLAVLPGADLQRLIYEEPQLTLALLQVSSQRLAHIAHLSETLGAWTVSWRINDCLLTYAISTDGQFVVPMTHERLAEFAGTGREVVTRYLSQLEDHGIIRMEAGRIILLSIDELGCPSNLVLQASV